MEGCDVSPSAAQHANQGDYTEAGCLDRPPEALPAFLRPDLDMTTAIQTLGPGAAPASKSPGFVSGLSRLVADERVDLVPNFYSYAVKSCLQPIRKVQHELVTLYFQYIHPTFPVVDEYHFNSLHRKYMGREELLHPLDFMIYQAILAAGFGHLSENQLRRTFYKSVHAGQEAQFDQVKERYWSRATNDPVVLTQICLILSLWSPGPADEQNNSFWLNRAFIHAAAGELSKAEPDADGRPSRHRLLWWCCLVRDRTLALGMRRPYRLHATSSKDFDISHLDFGLEALHPSFTDLHSKQIEIRAFIWLCKLSEIMAGMAIFQQRNKFARDWSGETVDGSLRELQRATPFDHDLTKWRNAFETDMFGFIRSHGDEDVPIPISILRIISNTLVAVLYAPYLHFSCLDQSAPINLDVDPLQRIKESAQAVETSISGLIQHNKSDALPNWLVTWVGLPVAVYHVCHHLKFDKTPEKVLMPFFNRFMRRTTGAQAIFLVLVRATKESFQKLNDGDERTRAASPEAEAVSSLTLADDMDPEARERHRVLEAKMLAHVTKALDYALELQC